MSNKEFIQTDKAPAAIGPYSQAVAFEKWVFTSGAIPVHAQTGEIPEDFVQQADLALQNLGEVLKAAGAGYDTVLKTTVFLADMEDFAAFNEIYARYFTEKPARSCVAVKTLPKQVRVEVEAIALRG